MSDRRELQKINSFGDEAKADLHSKGKEINREFQDSVFRDLFKNKANLLDLYRALHSEDTSVTEHDITLITLERVISNGIRNDVAFQVGDRIMILAEHQSTINQNMPLRMLLYYADEILKYLESRNLSPHRTELIQLPSVEFYIVYSGARSWNTEYLRLSDAFSTDTSSIELIVKMIHKGDYEGSIVDEYLQFVYKVREYAGNNMKNNEVLRDAILKAIDFCVPRGILSSYLIERRNEVLGMLRFEISAEEYAKEERIRGQVEGIIKLAIFDNSPKTKTIEMLQTALQMTEEEARLNLENYLANHRDVSML